MSSVCLLGGCAHEELKKCVNQVPADFYYCPKKVDGDFRMCKAPEDVYQCADPK